MIPRLLAAAACLLLAACFDIREEVWIHHDGSGRAELRYTIPESALQLAGGEAGLEEKIRALVAGQPQLALDAVQVSVADERATVAANLSTRSVLSLLDLQQSEGFQSLPNSATQLAGTFVVKPSGLDVDFSRTIHVREALGLASIAIGGEERKQRKLTYIIHLPEAAEEHNATRVENDARTLVWEASLGEALKRPVTTRFRAPVPLPWYVHATAAGLVIGILALWWRWRLGRRARRIIRCHG